MSLPVACQRTVPPDSSSRPVIWTFPWATLLITYFTIPLSAGTDCIAALVSRADVDASRRSRASSKYSCDLRRSGLTRRVTDEVESISNSTVSFATAPTEGSDIAGPPSAAEGTTRKDAFASELVKGTPAEWQCWCHTPLGCVETAGDPGAPSRGLCSPFGRTSDEYFKILSRCSLPATLARATCTNRLFVSLHVIAEHQLLGVRFQVCLSGQIRNAEHAHVMTDERERHDERNETAPIVGDRVRQFVLRRSVQPILEVACHVLQDVRMQTGRRQSRQHLHEALDVALLHVPPWQRGGARDETAKLPIPSGAAQAAAACATCETHQIARCPPRANRSRRREYANTRSRKLSRSRGSSSRPSSSTRRCENCSTSAAANRPQPVVPQLRGRRKLSPARVRNSASPSSGHNLRDPRVVLKR